MASVDNYFYLKLIRHGTIDCKPIAKSIKRVLLHCEELLLNQLEKCVVFDVKLTFPIKETLLDQLGNTSKLHLTELVRWKSKKTATAYWLLMSWSVSWRWLWAEAMLNMGNEDRLLAKVVSIFLYGNEGGRLHSISFVFLRNTAKPPLNNALNEKVSW